ncbi:MAG: group II intron reverse transcriptase domain-containing protein [Cyclobacteriaceae bacterium]|nr:group II intron reverse transcriptase domain-containing protein [Cyclobacteriaceae bacterium]
MLFSEDIWNQWVARTEDKFERKSYIHFDHPFDFVKRQNEIKSFFTTSGKISKHSFLPLIKIITKTPRFKFQDDLREYGLETKERPISFASHLDTFLYGFYSYALTEVYQKYIKDRGFDDCVLAYRTDLNGKCNIQFAKEAFETIRAKGPCTALALDIKGYFDSIDHTILKSMWCRVLGQLSLAPDDYAIYKSLTKYAYVKQSTLLKHFGLKVRGKNIKKPSSYSNILKGKTLSEKLNSLREDDVIVVNRAHEVLANGKKRYFGIPQGSSLSALLSNVYLLEFDEFMFKIGQERNFVYRRYCDDILIICPTRDATDIQKIIIDTIRNDFHLTIQDKKVEMIEFAFNSKKQIRAFNLKKISQDLPSQLNSSNEQRYYKNLQYLGFEFTGQTILIRNSSLSRYFRKMRARIVKTIGMAYGKRAVSDRVFKEQILHRYTHLGKRNFLHYAYHASQNEYRVRKGIRTGMDSPAIRKQLARHFQIIFKSLSIKNSKRFAFKIASGKGTKFKKI